MLTNDRGGPEAVEVGELPGGIRWCESQKMTGGDGGFAIKRTKTVTRPELLYSRRFSIWRKWIVFLANSINTSMPASLENQFISDLYTSLLHLSGAELGNAVNQVYDGVGNRTGIALSGKNEGSQVIINGYVQPIGFTDRDKPSTWLDAFFPIGVIHLSINNENPGVRIAGTTWEQVAQGKFIVGVGVGTDKNNNSKEFGPEGTGAGNEEGEYSHELTENELSKPWSRG